jgi:hypothetical protein
MNYVMRHGRRIEVEMLDIPEVEKKKRKQRAARWVKLSRHWITALRNTRSVHTYQLAHTILIEAYERGTQELTLSAATTRNVAGNQDKIGAGVGRVWPDSTKTGGQ